MRPRALTIGLIAALALVGGGIDPAAAQLPAPGDLTVSGGEETWHPRSYFNLRWTNPDTGFGLPITGAAYLVRDPAGAIVIEGTAWDGASFQLAGPPGIYTAEVWVNTIAGPGAHATAKLRYDNTKPPPVAAIDPRRWLGRSDFPALIGIEHPRAPLPVSGIRGYAVSIDGSPDGVPCAGADSCTETETDLRGGVEDDSIAVAELPEGESHVHVVAVSGSGLRSAAVGETVLRVDRTDPSTRIAGASDGWTNRAVPIVVTSEDSASGMGGGAFTAVQIDSAMPTVAPGSSVSATVIGDGVHRIARFAMDAAGNVNDGATRNGVRNHAPAISFARIDRDAPEVGFLDALDPTDPELIRARVADAMAGASSDRGSIAVRALGSGDRFEALPTRADDGALLARWNSEAYPPGRYEFRATGYDEAGNETSTQRRIDHSVMVLANPLKTQARLSIGFGGQTLVWQNCRRTGGARRCRRETVSDLARRPQSRVVPYGRGTLIGGRLTTASGAPLAGAPVRIHERLGRDGSGGERVTTLSSDGAGWFSIRLEGGPSREISASFDGSRTLTRATAAPLRLGVRTRVRFRVSAPTARVGGAPVVFRGRVVGERGEIPVEGKALSLQFRVAGMPWAEFRTVKTDRHGRFTYAYRFSDDDSRGVRFQFRAYAPEQSDWPYEPGSSGPVAVLGI